MRKNISMGLMGLVIVLLAWLGIVQNRELQVLREAEAAEVLVLEKSFESPPVVVAVPEKVIAAAEPEPLPAAEISPAKAQKDQLAAMVEMFKNPAMKKVARASMNGRLDVTYGALFNYLDLSEENLSLLKDMLVDRKMALTEAGFGLLDSSSSPEEKKAAANRQKEMASAYKKEIRDFLGTENSEVFDQYENTQSERLLVNMYSQSIEGEYQLSEDQEHELILAMYEERDRFPFSTVLADDENMDMSKLTSDVIAAHIAELAQLEEKYIERAKALLDPSQIESFAESLQQFRAMQEANLRMASQMFAADETN